MKTSFPALSRIVPALPRPRIAGIIDRRMLVNYRCDPDILRRLLPRPLQPRLVQSWGMAGLCLIRLKDLRPRGWPARWGFASENAAHRIAVEWEEAGERRAGVFVLRRDTNSRWNTFAGGRLFPGLHRLARFIVWESPCRLKLDLCSEDRALRIRVVARIEAGWPTDSVFGSLAAASRFFADGALGWSAARTPGKLEGLQLHVPNWAVEPLQIERVESSFFDDRTLFPAGAIALDNALLQRGLEHEWLALGQAHCATVDRPVPAEPCAVPGTVPAR